MFTATEEPGMAKKKKTERVRMGVILGELKLSYLRVFFFFNVYMSICFGKRGIQIVQEKPK